MSTKNTHWTDDPLNRLMGVVFAHLPKGKTEELARALNLRGTTISHAKKRAGAFIKHRPGIAEWLGVSVERLMELEKASGEPDFEERVLALMHGRTGDGNRAHKNIQIVPLAKDSAVGAGRLAVIALKTPDDGALVCFESKTGWQVGRYYRGEGVIIVVQPNKRAQHWPIASAPACSPLVMIGDRPDERKLV